MLAAKTSYRTICTRVVNLAGPTRDTLARGGIMPASARDHPLIAFEQSGFVLRLQHLSPHLRSSAVAAIRDMEEVRCVTYDEPFWRRWNKASVRIRVDLNPEYPGGAASDRVKRSLIGWAGRKCVTVFDSTGRVLISGHAQQQVHHNPTRRWNVVKVIGGIVAGAAATLGIFFAAVRYYNNTPSDRP